ncbi:hypothetical protein GEMRC1_012188 [Eukaryota sp. GEM-RC1]
MNEEQRSNFDNFWPESAELFSLPSFTHSELFLKRSGRLPISSSDVVHVLLHVQMNGKRENLSTFSLVSKMFNVPDENQFKTYLDDTIATITEISKIARRILNEKKSVTSTIRR